MEIYGDEIYGKKMLDIYLIVLDAVFCEVSHSSVKNTHILTAGCMQSLTQESLQQL